jgi:hypothetical protein
MVTGNNGDEQKFWKRDQCDEKFCTCVKNDAAGAPISELVIHLIEQDQFSGKKLPFLLVFRDFMKNGAFFVFMVCFESL